MSFLNNSSHQLLIGVVASMLIAFIFPWQYPFGWELKPLVTWGITGIFFFYGLKIDLKQGLADLGNWKLHATVQVFTFLVFPLVVLLFYPLFVNSEHYPLWLSVFFLAALPSTVSSAVIMASVAKGNLPAAILNASLTGLIGVLITPLWVGLFLSKSNLEIDFLAVFWDLTKQILLPLFIGLLLNKSLKNFTSKFKPILGWYDKLIIFIIIYKSFSVAFIEGVFTDFSWSVLFLLSAALIALYLLVVVFIKKVTQLLNFNPPDTKTAVLSASQKSLVHGSVFVIILVPSPTKQTLFLLAVMIYHSLQLLFSSYLAGRYGRN